MRKTAWTLTAIAITLSLVVAGRALLADEEHAHSEHTKPDAAKPDAPKSDEQIVKAQLADYPLDTCVVMGEKLTDKAVNHVHEGRLVRFCCPMCEKAFNKEPAKFLAKIDEAAAAKRNGPYPLETCPVSGQKLGAMGDPVVIQHEGREVKFCCGGCVAKFKKEPAKYLAKLDEAVIKAQSEDYPLDTCLVMGNELGEKPVDHVYRNRLVRFCCPDCVKKFEAEPGKYLLKLEQARAAKEAEAKAKYPLDTCVVSGQKLGKMGDPVVIQHEGQEVRFCCGGCVNAFKKDPAKYLAKIEAARKQAASHEGHGAMHGKPHSADHKQHSSDTESASHHDAHH